MHTNGNAAFGLYPREAEADAYQLVGLLVLEVISGQMGSLVAFVDPSVLVLFTLPPPLPD